jgi:hypothetical protein
MNRKKNGHANVPYKTGAQQIHRTNIIEEL